MIGCGGTATLIQRKMIQILARGIWQYLMKQPKWKAGGEGGGNTGGERSL